MSPLTYKQEDGKKIMWDGVVYASQEEAENKAAEYRSHGFETYNFNEEKSYFVYTRRVSLDAPNG